MYTCKHFCLKLLLLNERRSGGKGKQMGKKYRLYTNREAGIFHLNGKKHKMSANEIMKIRFDWNQNEVRSTRLTVVCQKRSFFMFYDTHSLNGAQPSCRYTFINIRIFQFDCWRVQCTMHNVRPGTHGPIFHFTNYRFRNKTELNFRCIVIALNKVV